MCDRANYSDSFSKKYWNNRNYIFLLKLYCLAPEEVRRFKSFSFLFHSKLIMFTLISYGINFDFTGVHLFFVFRN